MDGRFRTPRAAVAALLVVAALTACSRASPSTAPAPSSTLRLPPPPVGGFDPPVRVSVEGAPTLIAEVARRPDQRARGLMQRSELADDAGMVFLFPARGEGGFYMLGTLIPLSIAYVDGDRVVSTAEMRPCPGQICRSYPPSGPYTMAVEAPAGFFSRHGVRPGSVIRIIGETAAPE
ncbi:MAG TPA: DUF192 domain-containing protein [Mycobacteriales bacterium]|nr:DUF192 domain-containing protein [Mycobacteriales bacterium]